MMPRRSAPCQRVFAAFGNFLDGSGLFDDHLRLAHDLLAQWRHGNFGAAALKELGVKLLFQLLDGHTQGRL